MEPFLAVLRELRGPAAADEWHGFLIAIEPLCRAARSLPLLALRPDLGSVITLGGGAGLELLGRAPQLAALGVPLARWPVATCAILSCCTGWSSSAF
jgi:hypothetical protein